MYFYRYEGDSNKEVEDNTDHFSNLLKSIEERKRQRSLLNNKSISEDVNTLENNLEKPKKRKKNKSLPEEGQINNLYIENNSNVNNNVNKIINEQSSEIIEAQTKSKKRKRKDIKNADYSSIEHSSSHDQELDKTNTNLIDEEENSDNKNTTKNAISSQSNFMVLGAKPQKKLHAVKRVLPNWLAYPEVISADLNSGPSIKELHSILDHKLIEILKTNGIVKLFPVQFSVIKWLHMCNKDRRIGWWSRDTCVSAPTGSGKHLRYLQLIMISNSFR